MKLQFDHATSDWHLSNVNIIRYSKRPYADPQEMNEALMDNYQSVVGKNDTVLFLGDIAMGQIAESLPLIGKLNGRKLLIPGNHDRVHPCYFGPSKVHKMERWVKEYSEYFTILPLTVEDNEWIYCHFPYAGEGGDHDDELRYPEYRPEDNGKTLICGHVHDLWRTNGHQINVGVDVWDYTPVSYDQLKETDELGDFDCYGPPVLTAEAVKILNGPNPPRFQRNYDLLPTEKTGKEDGK